MKFSNSFLASLLVVAIIFSISVFLLVLGSVNSLKYTGFNVNEHVFKQGSINLSIDETASITTMDSPTIDFKNCRLLPGEYFTISSDGANETFESCYDYEVSNISVRNSGNIPVEVSVSASDVGELYGGNLLTSSANNLSDVSFKVTNSGLEGNKAGCFGDYTSNFTSFAEPSPTSYLVCDYLGVGVVGGNNSVVVDFRFVIPDEVEMGSTELSISFRAVAAI